MKPMVTILAMAALFALLLIFAAGCQLIGPRTAERVSAAVATYCQEPLAERLALREAVNGMTAPNSVRVTCAGDPE